MKFKKLASVFVAGALALSMMAPAFALGGSSGGTVTPTVTPTATPAASGDSSETTASVAVTSTTSVPTLNVSVATTGAIAINPYRLTIEINGEDAQDVLYSAPIYAVNESNCKVEVALSATVTIGGDIVLVGSADEVQTEEKDVKNVYLTLVTNTVEDNESAEPADTGDDSRVLTFEESGTAYGFGGEDDELEAIILEAGDEEANYFAMQFVGDANTNTSDVWTTADTLSASIVLTFAPLALDEEA